MAVNYVLIGSNEILEVRSRYQSDTCYLDPRFWEPNDQEVYITTELR